MEQVKYRRYSTAFKLEALELLASSGKSAAALERDLGITTGLLLKWRERYQVKKANGEKRLEASDLEAAQAEIRRFRATGWSKQLRLPHDTTIFN